MRSIEDAEPDPWPRRRFLGAMAAAGVAAIAAPIGNDLAAGEGSSAADRAAEGPSRGDLPILGSPHLLATRAPARLGSASWTEDQARLIHFHLTGSVRDRLLLGIP